MARWRVFGATWLSYAAYYLTRKNFSVAKESIQLEHGLTRGQLGLMDSAYSATYALGQFAWGLVGDKVGYRRVLVFGMLGSAACAVGFGASAAFAPFFVFFTVNGLAQSTGWPSNVKAMGVWFPREGRATVMGMWSTCYQVGSLVANPIATAFLVWASWRMAFFGPAAIVACVAVALLVFLPARDAPVDAAAVAAAAEARRSARARVLSTPLVWALGSAYFFLKLTRYALLFWLPYFMGKNGLGYDKSLAGNVPLAFEAGGVIGSITIGLISDRVLGGKRLGVSIVCLVLLAGALPLYSFAAPRGILPNIAALALVGFLLFGPDTLLSGATAQDLGGEAAATAAGVINGVGSLGQIVGGYTVAKLSEGKGGWPLVFGVLGAGAAVAAVILTPFWLKKAGGPGRP